MMNEGWSYETLPDRPAKGARRRWDEARKNRLREMWGAGERVALMADILGTSPGAIYTMASAMKLERRLRRGGRRRKSLQTDTTSQRRFKGAVEGNGPRIVLEPHHPAFRKGTTFFPSTVIPASRIERLLKSGENSRKIGSQVTKGRWKGQPIFTLTLEERETCPRSCLNWSDCYGNNMPFAHRILDDGTLTRRLWGEMGGIAAKYPGGFVIRLHVLGDFYSTDYVAFWRQALSDFPGLNVFGFTARLPGDPIGDDLVRLVRDMPDRFVMRFSGGGYETHCAEVVDRPDQVTGIRCPAETDADRCCASCALCWQSDLTISFVRH